MGGEVEADDSYLRGNGTEVLQAKWPSLELLKRRGQVYTRPVYKVIRADDLSRNPSEGFYWRHHLLGSMLQLRRADQRELPALPHQAWEDACDQTTLARQRHRELFRHAKTKLNRYLWYLAVFRPGSSCCT